MLLIFMNARRPFPHKPWMLMNCCCFEKGEKSIYCHEFDSQDYHQKKAYKSMLFNGHGRLFNFFDNSSTVLFWYSWD